MSGIAARRGFELAVLSEENRKLREENSRLRHELALVREAKRAVCVYCGAPTRSRIRVCMAHMDLVE